MSAEALTRRLSPADLLLVAACVFWGTNFVVVKSALAEFHPMAFNGIRFALGAAVLLVLQWRFEGFGVLRPVLRHVIVLGVIGNTAYQVLFIYGIALTEASQASLLVSTTPMWVLILAGLSGHDRFSGRVIIGLVLGLAGVALLLRESFNGVGSEQQFWLGNLLLLGASVSWAIYTVYSQPLLLQLRPLALTSAMMGVGAVPLLAMGLPEILAIKADDVSLTSWAGLVYSAFFALAFSYIVWSRGVRAIGSTRTSLYVNLVPVVATATAWVWLGERLSSLQLVGAGAVIAGIALSRRLSSPTDQ